MPHLAPLHWMLMPLFIILLMYLQTVLMHSSSPILFSKNTNLPSSPPRSLNWK
uniref:ATP synthase F0 subunit 8 n=1 Tax=Ramisyllis multicaudata TaxID=1166726 RepID=A0A0K0YD79_RAMMU|nr:ATP synthase F0 subunit 8 [Ramisyllis multicaudata]AKS48920.1 ATP synthase F0 subunit 8 [Ramisyllis multicaudata]